MGLHEKCFILVGVGPLASARAARWIRKNILCIHIPDAAIERLESADKQRQEGKRICIENMLQIKYMGGISGVNVMSFRQEELIS